MKLKKALAGVLAGVMVLGSTVSAFGATLSNMTCGTWWESHSKGILLEDGKEVNIKFSQTTTGSNNWDSATYVVYTSSDGNYGVAGDAGYVEYFVGRSDVYGWCADANVGGGNTIDGLTGGLSFAINAAPADDDAWAAWRKGLKSQSSTIVAKRDGKTVTVTYTVGACSGTATLPVGSASKVYIGLTGENCTISGISYETKSKELPKGSKFTVDKNNYIVTKSGEVAFTGSAAKKVVIPATVKDTDGNEYKVTSIKKAALKGKTKVTSVTIGANVTTIEKNAFAGAKALEEIIVESKSIKSVGKAAFKNVPATATVTVPTKKLVKTYKKLFQKSGLNTEIVVKKA